MIQQLSNIKLSFFIISCVNCNNPFVLFEFKTVILLFTIYRLNRYFFLTFKFIEILKVWYIILLHTLNHVETIVLAKVCVKERMFDHWLQSLFISDNFVPIFIFGSVYSFPLTIIGMVENYLSSKGENVREGKKAAKLAMNKSNRTYQLDWNSVHRHLLSEPNEQWTKTNWSFLLLLHFYSMCRGRMQSIHSFIHSFIWLVVFVLGEYNTNVNWNSSVRTDT